MASKPKYTYQKIMGIVNSTVAIAAHAENREVRRRTADVLRRSIMKIVKLVDQKELLDNEIELLDSNIRRASRPDSEPTSD